MIAGKQKEILYDQHGVLIVWKSYVRRVLVLLVGLSLMASMIRSIILEGARASTRFCVDVKPCAHGRIGRVAPPQTRVAADLLVCGSRAGDLARSLAS